MGQILPDDISKQIVYPSKLQNALELTIWLKDDITDFEVFDINKIKLYFKQDEISVCFNIFHYMCSKRRNAVRWLQV